MPSRSNSFPSIIRSSVIAKAATSVAEVESGSSVTLNSSASSVTETNPQYAYQWSSVPIGFTSSAQNPVVNPTSTTRYKVSITDINLECSDTASVIIRVKPSAVNDLKLQTSFSVYPTQTNGIVKLNGDFLKNDFEIYVNNLAGEQILKQGNISEIDLSGLPKGIYFIYGKSQNSYTLTNKIIKL